MFCFYLIVLLVPVTITLAQVARITDPPIEDDPCRTCEILLNIAIHHFHNNITDKDALQVQLQAECRSLAQTEGLTASQHCLTTVNANIDKIYADLQSNSGVLYTCQDLRICGPNATSMPLPPKEKIHRRTKRQSSSHDPCRVCETLMAIARRQFHNNIDIQAALAVQLNTECHTLAAHGFTNDEVANCLQLITDHIDVMYSELHTNPDLNVRQICTDVMQCTLSKQVLRQRM